MRQLLQALAAPWAGLIRALYPAPRLVQSRCDHLAKDPDLELEVCPQRISQECTGADIGLAASAQQAQLPDAWLAPLWLLMAQQYALHQSATLGLTPDNPFADGTVNRVVQGVTIYRHDQF